MKKILLFILLSFSFIHSQDSKYTKTEKYNCRDVYNSDRFVQELNFQAAMTREYYGRNMTIAEVAAVKRSVTYTKCEERQVPMTPKEIKKEKEKERIEAERIAEEKRIAAIKEKEKQQKQYIDNIYSSSVSLMMQYLNSPTKEEELNLYAYFEVFPIAFYNEKKAVKLTPDQKIKLIDSILMTNSATEKESTFSPVLNKLAGRESIGMRAYENDAFGHIVGDENAVFLKDTKEFVNFSEHFLKYVYINMDGSKSSLLQSYRESFNTIKDKPTAARGHAKHGRWFTLRVIDMYDSRTDIKEGNSSKAVRKINGLFKAAVVKNKVNINYDLVD